MRRFARFLLFVVILPLAAVEIWQEITRSAISASGEFMPTTDIRVIVPEGTRIPAVVKNVFSASTKPGDEIFAFTTEAEVINGALAIPRGARLNGFVEQITRTNSQAETVLRFRSLVLGEKVFQIETDPVITNATIQSDFEILGNALDTVTEAGIGVAMGAQSKSAGGIAAGLTAGALRGAAVMDSINVKITLVFTQPLEVIR